MRNEIKQLLLSRADRTSKLIAIKLCGEKRDPKQRLKITKYKLSTCICVANTSTLPFFKEPLDASRPLISKQPKIMQFPAYTKTSSSSLFSTPAMIQSDVFLLFLLLQRWMVHERNTSSLWQPSLLITRFINKVAILKTFNLGGKKKITLCKWLIMQQLSNFRQVCGPLTRKDNEENKGSLS